MSGHDASYLLSRHNELLDRDASEAHLQYLEIATGIKFAGRVIVGPSAGFRAVEHYNTLHPKLQNFLYNKYNEIFNTPLEMEESL